MGTPQKIFAANLCAAWVILLWVSVHAVAAMGINAAGTVFIADFSHPWRAQFGTDFAIHLLLVASWLVWRSRSWLVGIICAALAINLGSLFTLAFILVSMLRNGGDLRKVLLGYRA